MKQILKVSLLAAAMSLVITGCQQDEKKADAAAGKAPEAKAEVKKDAASSALKTFEETSAYAIGQSMGRYIANTLERQQELGVKLDNAVIMQGVKDGLAKNSLLDEKQLEKALKDYDQKINEAAAKKAADDAKTSLEKGKKFLEENAKKKGVTVTKSGLQYEVLTEGKGDQPKASDIVKVHYTGTLIDGTKFDSSYDRNEPAEFPLDHVIPGWTEGVQLMKVGAKYKFYLPSQLAYGEQGAGSIPPNSVLVFEVELLSIGKDKADEAAKPAEAKK
ncbi:FKBP-type peptidyl-prolyl cis-trans isomerase [Pseudaeromonas sharmana]|uniref:Peptidyl-prolyl cis-trans isomerase n=1 Tax=Pseudaeromonas sharmana TaxID=328412 RepID=A0ABV8CIQ9_9GAMM